jgi:serine protease AprX
MAPVQGISWDDRKRRTVTAMAAASVALLTASTFATAVHAAPRMVSVIVRALPGQGAAANQDITSVGGQVTQQISLINAVVANVPANAVPELSAAPGVAQVTSNAPIHLLGSSYSATGGSYNPATDIDSMFNVEQMDGAHAYWDAGYTGQGVGVALIDSGVAPVNGLTTPGKVVYGPDYSSEARNSSLRNLDTFGHGTHMAGIIAGLDNGVTSVSSSDSSDFMGMAPNAQIVSLKVANALGQTTVSQVLMAISWVVRHQNSLNIGVLNLSYGTDTDNSYVMDPLAYAAEQAWLSGIVVVVAAGNEGNNSGGLEDPAIDPYVIAVGAADTENTMSVSNDRPASFTSEGDGTRNPDLAAPGTHIVSLRDPSSFIDDTFGAAATVDGRFFLGSGTSQAAAIVSGAAALLLSQRPWLTPDQVKALLVDNTNSMQGPADLIGNGELNLAGVLKAPDPNAADAAQSWPTSNGGRSYGSMWPYGASWSGASWSGASWSGASWSGASWSGASWSGASWSGASWSGASWSGSSWSDADWN